MDSPSPRLGSIWRRAKKLRGREVVHEGVEAQGSADGNQRRIRIFLMVCVVTPGRGRVAKSVIGLPAELAGARWRPARGDGDYSEAIMIK